MKKYGIVFIGLTICLLFSCKDDEKIYGTDLYHYNFDIPSNEFIIKDNMFDYTFRIINGYNQYGTIYNIDTLQIINESDTITVVNHIQVVEEQRIIKDTVKNNWITAINENDNQIRVIIDKNNGNTIRTSRIVVNVDRHSCDPLIIHQLPPN